MFILGTISIATFLFSLVIHPSWAAPLLFIYELFMIGILMIRPIKRLVIQSGARGP